MLVIAFEINIYVIVKVTVHVIAYIQVMQSISK